MLDPELRQFLEKLDAAFVKGLAVPSSSEVKGWAQGRRAAGAARTAARPPVRPPDLTVEDHQVPGENGQPPVLVRIYRRPSLTSGPRPALVWLYGGMFMFGALADVEDQYTRLAQDLDAVIVGVDYRKAPEDPFPAAAEDCYTAVKWLAENAERLGIDPDRIAVAGASAGGTLTATVALMARDRGGPKIAAQFPMMAALDDRMATPSANDITDERMANHDILVRVWDEYLGPMRAGEVSPYAAPGRVQDLAGLPPTYIFVGELDPMRDENVEYAARLTHAGVTAELHVYPGAFHQFAAMVPGAAVSKRAQGDFLDGVKRAFARAGAAAPQSVAAG